MLDRGRLASRLLDRLAHRDARAAAERVVGGDHDLCLRVLQPLHDRGRGEAGEDRHLDRADVRARVRRGGCLGRHRQVDRDAVARLDAERLQGLGDPDRLAGELGERPFAPGAVLAAEDGSGSVAACARPRRAGTRSPRSAALPRTRSSTRSHASRRAPDPRDGRARGRDRPPPRARSGRARRARAGAVRDSPRSRGYGRAG